MGLVGLVAAVTAMVGGVLWDISWDASVGADSFWSPPHMATNFGAAAAGLFGLITIWQSSRRRPGTSPRRGNLPLPLGAGLVVWGSVAMLGWVILDDWWSRSYGLYVQRWSPPEILFTVAAVAILVGATIALTAAAQRSGGIASVAVLWVIGLLIAFAVAAMTPLGTANLHRTTTFYLVVSLIFPLLLAGAAAAHPHAWSATTAALLYTGFVCVLVWTFPLFAAQPRIGPIYEPVEKLIPPPFPLLLFLPALGSDACTRRFGPGMVRALACGAAFLLLFLPVQWAFSSFLLSPAADNWFFAGGGRYWPFYLQIGPERTTFWGLDADALSAGSVLVGFGAAVVSAAVGSTLGRWMREQRG